MFLVRIKSFIPNCLVWVAHCPKEINHTSLLHLTMCITYRAALLQNWSDGKNNCQHEVTYNNKPRVSTRNLARKTLIFTDCGNEKYSQNGTWNSTIKITLTLCLSWLPLGNKRLCLFNFSHMVKSDSFLSSSSNTFSKSAFEKYSPVFSFIPKTKEQHF